MHMGRRTSRAFSVALFVSWASFLAPLTRAQEAGVVEPPPTFVNGVAGVPVSWCNDSGCADGFLPESDSLPLISGPFALEVPSGAHVEQVRSWEAGSRRPESVPFSGTTIGAVPNSAVMLSVSVRFEEGGSAVYFWALDVAASPQPLVPDTAMKAP